MSAGFDRHPFLLSVDNVAKQLDTDIEKGLTTPQVEKLSQEYDRNELDVGGAIQWYTIFIRQLFNAMIIVRFCLLQVFARADYVENQYALTIHLGLDTGRGRLIRVSGLGRRQCVGFCHCPQRFHRFRSRIHGREEDGRPSGPVVSECHGGP